MSLQRARLVAPGIHLTLFAATWLLYAIQRQPLLDGPSKWPFGVLFLADFPISALAFAAMFVSDASFPYALAAWGVFGTIEWYFVGQLFIPKKTRRG
jgi:hypothetical protein